MKLLNFIIIKLTLCLIIGILLGYFIDLNFTFLIVLTTLLIIILAIIYLLNYSSKKPIWIGILIYLASISLGVLTSKTHNQSNFNTHYTKLKNIHKDSIYLINFRVREVLKPGNFHTKYVIEILNVNKQVTKGRVLLNITKDSLFQTLNVDDTYITKSEFKKLTPPLNPHQFDYKSYLKKQHIYHQLFISNSSLLKNSNRKHTIYGYAGKLREHININLRRYNFKIEELAIINALLLGQRQDISKEIYNSYTQAGAIHILAVSGLHVGIILFLLNFLFKPLELLKYGKTYKTIILILILWSFAIIAGLSASVVRAVTMFTIVAIAINWDRPTNVYNTLTISMFFLLLFKPNFLFDVGFQLSYLAVFSIVTIQPMLYKLWIPRFKLTRFFWNIFTVTISAQFGIIPISLYYFHQFPGLFFVSNLVIIPFLGIILGFGIIIIGLALINLLPGFLANIFGFIISKMNTFVTWVANQEAFIIKNISFNIASVFISYLALTLIVYWIKKRNYKATITLLFATLSIQCFIFITNYKKPSNTFVVFHKSRHSIIGIKQQQKLQIYSNNSDSIMAQNKMITNYKVGTNAKNTIFDSIPRIVQFNNKTLLIIDSIAVYQVKSFRPDIILLQHSPKINLTRLIDSLQPQLIISDGSNYKSYQERWEVTCNAKKIPFHRTSKKGAFIYRY